MFEDTRYAFLVGASIFALVWLVLFIVRKDLRRQMLIISLLVAPMGPLSEFFYLRDYWRPEFFFDWFIPLEDLIFGFTLGGIAAVIYESVFGKRYSKRHARFHQTWMFVAAAAMFAFMVVGNLILGVNSIYISSLGLLIVGAAMLLYRHDLLIEAFASGMLTGLLMLFFYIIFTNLFEGIIEKWWMLENISGAMLWGAPLEELLWGFSWGFAAGPAYEFAYGLRLRKS